MLVVYMYMGVAYKQGVLTSNECTINLCGCLDVVNINDLLRIMGKVQTNQTENYQQGGQHKQLESVW